jgi:hypothetical protein
MNDFLISTGVIAGYIYLAIILFALIMIFINPDWLIQEYPKEWEEAEDREIKRKFDEHKKSQE